MYISEVPVLVIKEEEFIFPTCIVNIQIVRCCGRLYFRKRRYNFFSPLRAYSCSCFSERVTSYDVMRCYKESITFYLNCRNLQLPF